MISALLHPPPPTQRNPAPALASALRQRRGAGARRSRARRPPAVRADRRRCARARAPVRRSCASSHPGRCRCCACRTGRCCRTTCSRRIRTSSPSGCRRSTSCRTPRHGCLIVAADTLMQRLPPRQYVQGRAFELADGPGARHRAVPAAPRRGRLRERQPGGEPGRVRRARLAARCLPDGHRDAAAHRSVRR